MFEERERLKKTCEVEKRSRVIEVERKLNEKRGGKGKERNFVGEEELQREGGKERKG